MNGTQKWQGRSQMEGSFCDQPGKLFIRRSYYVSGNSGGKEKEEEGRDVWGCGALLWSVFEAPFRAINTNMKETFLSSFFKLEIREKQTIVQFLCMFPDRSAWSNMDFLWCFICSEVEKLVQTRKAVFENLFKTGMDGPGPPRGTP